MQVSPQGMRFVACREALVTRAYSDGKYKTGPLKGQLKYSIGFGSQSPPPKDGDTITIEAAFARLKEDIRSREPDVNRALKVAISQAQFDALFSLYYQAGTVALRAVAALFNKKTPLLALGEFTRYNLDNGVPSEGLTMRRILEAFLGAKDYYGDLSQIAYWNGNPRLVPRQWMPFPDNL